MLRFPVVLRAILAVRTAHTTRRKASLLVAAAILGALLASSQARAEEAVGEGPDNSLRAGVWAMEFELQPGLFGKYGGAGIAAKRHFTSRSALGLGALVAINHSDGSGTRKTERAFPYDSTVTTARIENESDQRDVSLFLHYIRFLDVGGRAGIFLLAGPTVQWSSGENVNVDKYPPLSLGVYPTGFTRSYSSDFNSWNYGVDVGAGFEWFFSRRLSLAGQFGMSALLTNMDRTDAYAFEYPPTGDSARELDSMHSDGFTVRTTPAVVSLIAYF